MTKLGNLIAEHTEKTTINNQYEVLTSSQNGLFSQEDYFNKQVASINNIGYKIIKKGQYTYRSMSDTGKFYINRLTKKNIGIVSPAYPVFELTSANILPEFLDLFFQSDLFQNQISNKSTGSTRLALRFSKLENVEVPLLSIDEQSKIIADIKFLKEVIANENNELYSFDSLVKSRFIEMFVNKGYPLVPLKELSLEKAQYGAGSASVPYEEGRPRYVRITDINDDGTLNDDIVCSANNSDDNEYKLKYGDFMFARMGATVGKTYAFFDGNEIYAGYLIRYRLNLNKINPRYLFSFTKLDSYFQWVKDNQSGSAQPGINAKKYDTLLVPLPPIELQNEFASFVQLIDKLKFNAQERIKLYQELLDKKMDEYFN